MMKLRQLILIPLILLISACNTQTNNTEIDGPKTDVTSSSTEVTISDAWVRESAPGQGVGAAYMTLNSPKKSSLVYTEAIDTAGSVEIHSMTMNDGVMKMRMLEELTLAPNKPVSLKPGSFHLMLFDLKAPLEAGQNVNLRLCFKDESGEITEQFITVPVKSAQ